jgi:peptidoglycan/xylan/chitin deacetylase (PgdA/CDA1 family)
MRTISLLFHDVYATNPAASGFRGVVADRYKIALKHFDELLHAIDAGDPSCIRLTVDDGGSSYYAHMADRLEARGWRGYCFMPTALIGERGFLTARQLQDLDQRGHVIGTHSASHPTRFSACSLPRMIREWTESRMALEDLLGHDVRVASLPGGYYSPTVARSANAAGLEELFTSEPTTRVWRYGECRIAGRFTIRPSHGPEDVRALIAAVPLARWREWAAWNAKKAVKPLLGSMYPRLGAWIRAPRRVA